MMKNLFQRTSSNWVRYSEYEWREAEDGTLFLTPTKTAQPSIYDPLSEYQRLILDAIDIGRMESQKKTPQEIQKAIQQFAMKYGLLGLMTALPTELYGLRGSISAEESFYPRGIHVHNGLSESVLSL